MADIAADGLAWVARTRSAADYSITATLSVVPDPLEPDGRRRNIFTPTYSLGSDPLDSMPGWWHHLDTTWIVSTDQNLQDLTNHVHALAGPDDNFIIMDVTFGNYNGWLPSKAWEWLRNENVRERNRIAHAPNGQT